MVPNIWHQYIYMLGYFFVWTRAELFTALCEIEPLLDTRKRIIDDLDRYIEWREQGLQVLKKYLQILKSEHETAMGDIPNYIGNPINAFTLIKRLTTDLDHIKTTIDNDTELTKNMSLLHADLKYPTMEDLTGAVQALARLQEVYNLSVSDLSEGIVNSVGVAHGTPMSVGDCFELGRALYNDKDFEHALAWMMQALRKHRDTTDPRPLNEADILEYISFSHYLIDDTKSALKWAKKLLKVDPKHPRARSRILDYENIIAEEQKTELQVKHHWEFGGGDENTSSQKLTLRELRIKMYQSLCTGQMDLPAEITKGYKYFTTMCAYFAETLFTDAFLETTILRILRRLHCRYVFGPHPFLRVAPLKMELLYWRPRVALFHHVLSDTDIQHIKDLAKPKLERAGIYDPESGKRMASSKLLSKSSWISDAESPVVTRVSQRVADMTGLCVHSSEDLYVINYGIGGHYEPHLDSLTNKLREQKSLKNRLASVMFYMSEIAEGATVFPKIGLRLYPEKGSAVFWLNLHPSGETDLATMHAACPVLHGSKWVAIKWIHQEGQELLRPCTLKYQPEGWP